MGQGQIQITYIIKKQYFDGINSIQNQIIIFNNNIHHYLSLSINKIKLINKIDSEGSRNLELNFTLNVADFGSTKTIELKPGGSDIFVNDDNKIEYMHLVADYKLNKQINRQVRKNSAK